MIAYGSSTADRRGMTHRSPNEILEETLQQVCEMDGSLDQRLQRFAAVSRTLNPVYAGLVDELVDRLRRADAGAASPQPGDRMPPFLLSDHSGRMVGLDDLVCQGPVALIFHRGHWCPYCRINTRTLAQIHPAVREAGGEIVAIMPDRQRFTSRLREELGLPFPLLTDLDNGYALSLNLAVWLGAELRDFFASRRHDLPEYQGNEAWMVPIPAAFVVGSDVRVAARFIDPDYRRGMDVDALLNAIKNAH
jgi:peroxiredoxin